MTSLSVQWLRLCASNAGGLDWIPDPWWGNEGPACCVVWPKKKEKKIFLYLYSWRNIGVWFSCVISLALVLECPEITVWYIALCLL